MTAEEQRSDSHREEVIHLLSLTPFFSGLTAAELAKLADIGTEEQFAARQQIFREGEKGDKFFLVIEGAVRISRNVTGAGEEALAILRAGAPFGEMSLIEDAERSADAFAHEATRLFVVRKEDLEHLLESDHDLAYTVHRWLVRILSERLREMNNKLTFLSFAGRF